MIRRTYICDNCEHRWEIECNSDDPDPACPNPDCDKILQWVPTRLNINTHKSRAIDLTQKIIEEDYGLTNLNDRNREGDIAYKPAPPPHTAELEKVEREVREYVAQVTAPVPVPEQNRTQAMAVDVNMNWGGRPGPAVAAQPISTRLALEGTRQGPGANIDPVAMLQKSAKAAGGQDYFKRHIMGRWKP